MTRKIKLTRANKSILLKALAPYYYQEKALGHNTENPGRLILKIDSVPADKKATFSTEEIRLMRITINRLRIERLESFCSEQNARMSAMQVANDSAAEMIRNLSIEYNRARQSMITQEITEVISGAKAQKKKKKARKEVM